MIRFSLPLRTPPREVLLSRAELAYTWLAAAGGSELVQKASLTPAAGGDAAVSEMEADGEGGMRDVETEAPRAHGLPSLP